MRKCGFNRNLYSIGPIEYLAALKISRPGYTVLQDVIGGAVGTTNRRLTRRLDYLISADLADGLSDLVAGKDSVTLQQLRMSARNLTGSVSREMN